MELDQIIQYASDAPVVVVLYFLWRIEKRLTKLELTINFMNGQGNAKNRGDLPRLSNDRMRGGEAK